MDDILKSAPAPSDDAEVIGVRFKEVGKIYYFDPDGISFSLGQRVIVETIRGVECGEVAMANRKITNNQIVKPLKKVIRPASDADLQQLEANKQKEKQAFSVCQKKISEHRLDMKLVDVEYTFDNNKILLLYCRWAGRFPRTGKGFSFYFQNTH